MCGDATAFEDVNTFMDGKRANLILTASPYDMSFKACDGLTIKNDSLKGEAFYNFLFFEFENMADHLEKSGAAYCFHTDTEDLIFRKTFVDADFHLAGVCIWVKNSLVLSCFFPPNPGLSSRHLSPYPTSNHERKPARLFNCDTHPCKKRLG